MKAGRRRRRLEALRALETTVVCYESPHRIAATLEALGEVWGEAEVIVARELTKQFEEIVAGPPSALVSRFADGRGRGEFTLVIPRPGDRSSRILGAHADSESPHDRRL